jgi:ubiquitin carboxyl-terminal hydrolase 4/11/15
LNRYLIDTRWFKQLKQYLGLDLESGSSSEGDRNSHPGPIDNSPLFKKDPDEASEPGDLREHMIDELDFVLVPEEAWALLVNEFSITQGQLPIARKV